MQGVIAQAKKLDKSVYIFSVDADGEKVMHINYVSPAARKSGLDGKSWASTVTAILGGKVGEWW